MRLRRIIQRILPHDRVTHGRGPTALRALIVVAVRATIRQVERTLVHVALLPRLLQHARHQLAIVPLMPTVEAGSRVPPLVAGRRSVVRRTA